MGYSDVRDVVPANGADPFAYELPVGEGSAPYSGAMPLAFESPTLNVLKKVLMLCFNLVDYSFIHIICLRIYLFLDDFYT